MRRLSLMRSWIAAEGLSAVTIFAIMYFCITSTLYQIGDQQSWYDAPVATISPVSGEYDQSEPNYEVGYVSAVSISYKQ